MYFSYYLSGISQIDRTEQPQQIANTRLFGIDQIEALALGITSYIFRSVCLIIRLCVCLHILIEILCERRDQ